MEGLPERIQGACDWKGKDKFEENSLVLKEAEDGTRAWRCHCPVADSVPGF